MSARAARYSSPPAGTQRTHREGGAHRPGGRPAIQTAGPAPRPAAVKAALVVVGGGLGASVGLALTAETRAEFAAAGGPAIFLGSFTGLVGTYLALIMVLLVSRMPFVERVLGQDGLLRWHRWLAPWPISLLITHAVLITIGYAQAARTGLLHQVGVLITQYPDVLLATAALGIMCVIAVVSVRAVRRRLPRERWWLIHLYMYLALAMSYAHVIALGPSFVGHPLTQAVWAVLWIATAGVVLLYRFGLPIARSLRYRLEVVEVRPEGPGVVSVILCGRNVEKLRVSGGQFFLWRFLTPGMWWQAHPYSLSALPRPPYLRLTVKNVGDHSGELATLAPGTKVAIEGPYGAFTPHAQQHSRALLIAGGIGVTALRSLLEDLPPGSAPVVIIRVSREADLVLRREIDWLTRRLGGELYVVVGNRAQVRFDERSLVQLVPDISRRDVYICGPDGFVREFVDTVKYLGVADEFIHHEAFAL
jgi:predicted ferric reductase